MYGLNVTLPRPLLSKSSLDVSPPDAAAPVVAEEDVEDEVDFEEEEVRVDEMFDVAIVLLRTDEVPVCDIVEDEVEVHGC